MKWKQTVLVALLTIEAAIAGVGCTSKDGEGPVEQAGKAIDNTMEKVDDKLKGVAADTKKTVKETAEDLNNSAKE